MSHIVFSCDASDAINELKRLENAPSHSTYLALVGVTTAQFQATQAFVHVQTGSLRTSGKCNPDFNHETHEYTGEITYGGTAEGAVHDPVTYAKYEQRRAGLANTYDGLFKTRSLAKHPKKHHHPLPSAHGTSHNFMQPIPIFEHGYTEALLDEMRGGR